MKVNQEKIYNQRQQKLLTIWNEYTAAAKEINQPIREILFINKTPKNVRNEKRNLAGIPATCINYLEYGEEVQKMTIQNFLYLMVKMGIEIEIEDKKKGGC